MLIVVFVLLQILTAPNLLWDEAAYLSNARELVSDSNYVEEYRGPLWQGMIATVWFFTGEHILTARLLAILFGIGSVILTYLLADRYKLAFATLVAMNQQFFYWSGVAYSESAAIFFILATALTIRKKKYFFAGILISLATLTRFEYALVAIILGVFLLKDHNNVLRYGLGGLLVVTPWIVSNYLLHGHIFYDAILQYTVLSTFAIYEPPLTFVGRTLLYYFPFFILLAGVQWRKNLPWITAGSILFLIHTFLISVKVPRYTLIVFPFLIILTSKVTFSKNTLRKLLSILLLLSLIGLHAAVDERQQCSIVPELFTVTEPYITNETNVVSNVWPLLGYQYNVESHSLYSTQWQAYDTLNSPEYIIHTSPYGMPFPITTIQEWEQEGKISLILQEKSACGTITLWSVLPNPEREQLLRELDL